MSTEQEPTKKPDSTDPPPTIEQTIEQKLTIAASFLQSIAKPTIYFITFLFPHIVSTSRFLHRWWVSLPFDAANFVIGSIFCFFGGLYPTVFAAIQAAKHGGIKTCVSALNDLTKEAMFIIEQSKKDDELDEDNDGRRDVDQLDGKALLLRKGKLVLTKMDPVKVDNALNSLYMVWLSVLATLKLQFARTISLALTISDFVKQPIDRFIAPTIQLAVPDAYDKWVPVVIGWIAKSIAMSIAWYIQTIISAFTSALEGGLKMSRALMSMCRKRGLKFVPEDDETYLDEIFSYIFAALGFYFQFKLGFDVPFPFNLVLFPLEFAEYYIRWTITNTD